MMLNEHPTTDTTDHLLLKRKSIPENEETVNEKGKGISTLRSNVSLAFEGKKVDCAALREL